MEIHVSTDAQLGALYEHSGGACLRWLVDELMRDRASACGQTIEGTEIILLYHYHGHRAFLGALRHETLHAVLNRLGLFEESEALDRLCFVGTSKMGRACTGKAGIPC